MTTKAADDFESIRRRLEEIEAEQKLALTGSSAPVSEEPNDVESVYGIDCSGWREDYGLASMAHPEWPYAGTAHEWRGFVTDAQIKRIKQTFADNEALASKPVFDNGLRGWIKASG